jgi:hypothetical protein
LKLLVFVNCRCAWGSCLQWGQPRLLRLKLRLFFLTLLQPTSLGTHLHFRGLLLLRLLKVALRLMVFVTLRLMVFVMLRQVLVLVVILLVLRRRREREHPPSCRS